MANIKVEIKNGEKTVTISLDDVQRNFYGTLGNLYHNGAISKIELSKAHATFDTSIGTLYYYTDKDQIEKLCKQLEESQGLNDLLETCKKDIGLFHKFVDDEKRKSNDPLLKLLNRLKEELEEG